MVVIVLVVHFEQLQVGMIERARAPSTDPGKQFQSLRPVTLLPCFGAASRLKNKAIKTVVDLCHRATAFQLSKCFELMKRSGDL
jgi:hypothetical protein